MQASIKPYNLAVISSRRYVNGPVVFKTLNEYVAKHGVPVVVYIGAQAEGANPFVFDWARLNGFKYMLMESTIGRIQKCQHLIAFSFERSSGTNARLVYAQGIGIEHITVIDE